MLTTTLDHLCALNNALFTFYRTEKNATGWSKEKLKALLEGLKLEDDTCKHLDASDKYLLMLLLKTYL